MSYKCYECGHVFDESDLDFWEEDRGEYWGTRCSETLSGCPKCRGDYAEAVTCDVCGKDFFEEELNNGVCDCCIEKYRYNIDVCNNIGKNDDDKIELNCFLASVFSKEEIENILFEKLKEAQKYGQIDCKKFIESDRDWFVERLAEEVKKNENGKKQP